jgi:RimJ/RimL family protein N-acetyltransferase
VVVERPPVADYVPLVQHATFADKPTLRGRSVVLEPVTVADVPRLLELMRDRETSVLTGSTHRSDAADAVEHSLPVLQEVYGRWATATDRLVWTVRDAADGTVLGEAVLNDHDPDNRSCGFRLWLAEGRGRGLGTETTRLVVDHAFGALGLHRVELEVFAFNPRARHVYEKVGFVLEGTRRESLRFDDGWVDCHVMAMLRSDWESPRASS